MLRIRKAVVTFALASGTASLLASNTCKQGRRRETRLADLRRYVFPPPY
jgi:hypothetical protein